MGHVYLVRTKEFLVSDEPVYKVGRTNNPITIRGKGYPKGSQLILLIPVANNQIVEAKIKHAFKLQFRIRPDAGCEYFEGSKNKMITTIIRIIISQSTLC